MVSRPFYSSPRNWITDVWNVHYWQTMPQTVQHSALSYVYSPPWKKTYPQGTPLHPVTICQGFKSWKLKVGTILSHFANKTTSNKQNTFVIWRLGPVPPGWAEWKDSISRCGVTTQKREDKSVTVRHTHTSPIEATALWAWPKKSPIVLPA